MGITWDISLTSLIVGAVSVIGFYLVVIRTGDRVNMNSNSISSLRKTVEETRTSAAALHGEFQMFKDEIYKNYLPREEFNEVVTRLFDKLDDINDTLLQIARNGSNGTHR